MTVTSNASAHRIERIDNDLSVLRHRISVAGGTWLIRGPPGTGRGVQTLAKYVAGLEQGEEPDHQRRDD